MQKKVGRTTLVTIESYQDLKFRTTMTADQKYILIFSYQNFNEQKRHPNFQNSDLKCSKNISLDLTPVAFHRFELSLEK